MKNERQMRDEIRSALVAAGFSLVQFEAPIKQSSKVRPDVLAWATNTAGELVPWAVVEIKNGQFKTADLTLPGLQRSRDLLGTVDHYAVINGAWFKADRGVRSLEPVDGPTPPPHGTSGFLADEDMATSLLLGRLWREADKQRGRGSRIDFFFPSSDAMADSMQPGIETASGEFVPVDFEVLWRARRRALQEFASRGRTADLASHPVIAKAVAALAGTATAGTVVDPFCGTGSFLWSAMDRTIDDDGRAEFVGVELNSQLADLAATIGRTAPMLTTIEHGDAFVVDLPTADVVLTAPPLGMQLQAPRQLLDSSTTTDLSIAAVDLALRHLRPGGRAVMHLGAGFTFQRQSENYRNFLASEFRVGALLGLPSGAVVGTGVASVLLVIDRAEPAETFVAQLGEDWQTQLSPDGAAMRAVIEHLDGPSAE